METFSALLALCEGIYRSPVNSPHKGQWHGALMFSLICAWINVWVNNRSAGDLRRHRTHYDVIVMVMLWSHSEICRKFSHDCLLSRLFRRKSKKTSKLRVTGLCAGNSPVTREFPTQRTRKAENDCTNDGLVYWRIFGSLSQFFSRVANYNTRQAVFKIC